MLRSAHKVFSSPNPHSRNTATVPANAPLTGAHTVLPVIGHASFRAGGGARWLRVLLPGRPNGSKGWIPRRRVTLMRTGWRLVVRRSHRRLLVYRNGRRVRAFAVIVGKPSTPTPLGQFFVEESIRMPSGAPGAPFALALSARSDVLQEFEGGPGQIAVHGIANLGGTLGTAVSHGCVRVANSTSTWLARRIPAGARVAIRP